MRHDNVVNLLWTGGWDSTFRLCDLILIQKKRVQPIYIMDPERKSIREEIRAIETIRKLLKEVSLETRELLLPMNARWMGDIALNPTVTARYNNLVQRFGRLGSQYEWLGRFASECGIDGLELSVESDSFTPSGPVFAKLKDYLILQNGNYLLSDCLEESDFELFRPFHFPLAYTTKLDMLSYAKKRGFYDMMLHSWFCHLPKKGRPCGKCRPCSFVLDEGLAFRVPLSGRARYMMSKIGLKKR